MMEIKDTKDIIYDNYKVHHTKLGKDIRPKEHDVKKWVAVDDTIKIIHKIKEDRGSHKCQRIIQALSSSEKSRGVKDGM